MKMTVSIPADLALWYAQERAKAAQCLIESGDVYCTTIFRDSEGKTTSIEMQMPDEVLAKARLAETVKRKGQQLKAEAVVMMFEG
jgi:hypothetical protein